MNQEVLSHPIFGQTARVNKHWVLETCYGTFGCSNDPKSSKISCGRKETQNVVPKRVEKIPTRPKSLSVSQMSPNRSAFRHLQFLSPSSMEC